MIKIQPKVTEHFNMNLSDLPPHIRIILLHYLVRSAKNKLDTIPINSISSSLTVNENNSVGLEFL